MTENELNPRAGRMHLPRSRGAVSGIALIVLGLWGALAPFIGPYFDFAFTPDPDSAWHWTAARGWYEVLPGGVAFVGGLLLLFSANRAMTSLGAWIAVVAGGWFVVGPQVSPLITLGRIGSPASSGLRLATAEGLAFFTALGAVIILFAALSAGRLSVHSVRDARSAQRQAEADQRERERAAEAHDAEQRAAMDADRRAATERSASQNPADDGTMASDRAAADASADAVPAGDATSAETAGTTAHSGSDDRVATTERPDAPYAPGGHTPAPDEPPADASAAPGGPGYATPQRYVRGGDPDSGTHSVGSADRPPAEPSEQITVEQIRQDHEGR